MLLGRSWLLLVISKSCSKQHFIFAVQTIFTCHLNRVFIHTLQGEEGNKSGGKYISV